MKKSIAKSVSFILVAVIVFTMVACGKKESPASNETVKEDPAATEAVKEETAAEEPAKEAPAKEEAAAETSITGTYFGQLDFTEQASKEYSESLGFEVNDPLFMDVYLDLNEDNTFHLYVDAEKFKADVISLLSSHVDDLLAKSLEQNGMSPDQLDEVVKANGYDSEESFKAAMAEVLETELQESINLEEYEDDLNLSGNYAASGKTILMANEDGTDTATINDDGTLTMVVPFSGSNVEVILTKQE